MNLLPSFNIAYNLISQDITHEKTIQLLKNGNDIEKQYAALILNDIKSQKEAEILIGNLTGCDGKIREATAYKILDLLVNNNELCHIFSQLNPKIFADATIDINANICRCIVESCKFLNQDITFSQKYTNFILNILNEAFNEIDKFNFRDKKYVVNKQLFKLYWSLETLKNFYPYINNIELSNIIEKSMKIKEYTIREKAVQLIIILNEQKKYENLINNDTNYYVQKSLVSIQDCCF